jgi:hypothetical protein
MAGGMFSRIIYSSDSISMNGIYIAFDLSGHICEIFPSKFKIQFSPSGTTGSGSSMKSYSSSEYAANVIKSLCDIERGILARISIPGKNPLYKLHDQLVQNNFKFFWLADNISGPHPIASNTTPTNSVMKYRDVAGPCQTGRFILKISGCWTTPVSYGITYKFSRVASQEP